MQFSATLLTPLISLLIAGLQTPAPGALKYTAPCGLADPCRIIVDAGRRVRVAWA